jgi:hypothetical protein
MLGVDRFKEEVTASNTIEHMVAAERRVEAKFSCHAHTVGADIRMDTARFLWTHVGNLTISLKVACGLL